MALLHLPGAWSPPAGHQLHLLAPMWRPPVAPQNLAPIVDRQANRRPKRQAVIHQHEQQQQQQLDYDLRDELAGYQQPQHPRPHQQFKNKKPVNVSISQRTVNGLLSLLLLFAVSVSGSIGAILVISSLTVIESLQQRGNCYLVSLAMSHLLVTLLVIPTSALQIMAGEQGLDGRRLCHYQWLTLEFTLIVSHLSFLLVAADNYLGYKCSHKVATTAQLAAAAALASQQHYDSTAAASPLAPAPPPEVVSVLATGKRPLIDADNKMLPNGLIQLDRQAPECLSYRHCCGRLRVLLWILLVWLLAFAHTFNQHDRKYGPNFCTLPPPPSKTRQNNNPTWGQQWRNQAPFGSDHAHELAATTAPAELAASKFKERRAISGFVGIDRGKLVQVGHSQLAASAKRPGGWAAPPSGPIEQDNLRASLRRRRRRRKHSNEATDDDCDDESDMTLLGQAKATRRRRYASDNASDASGYHRNNGRQVPGDINLAAGFVAAWPISDGFEGQFNKAESADHSTLNWAHDGNGRRRRHGQQQQRRRRRRPNEEETYYYYWDARDLDGRLMNNNNAPRMQIGGAGRSPRGPANEAGRWPVLEEAAVVAAAAERARANKQRINRAQEAPTSLALSSSLQPQPPMPPPSVNQSDVGAAPEPPGPSHWLALIATTIVPALASGLLFGRAYLRMKEFKMRPQRQLSGAALQAAAATGLLTPSGHTSSVQQLRSRLSSSSSSSSSVSASEANTSCEEPERRGHPKVRLVYEAPEERHRHVRQQHSAPVVQPVAGAAPAAIVSPPDVAGRRQVDVVLSAPIGHQHQHPHQPPPLYQQQWAGLQPHRQASYSAPPPPPPPPPPSTSYEFRRSQHHAQSFHCGSQPPRLVSPLAPPEPVVAATHLAPDQQPLGRHRSLPRSSRLHQQQQQQTNTDGAGKPQEQLVVTEALASVIKSMDEDNNNNRLNNKKKKKKTMVVGKREHKKEHRRSQYQEQQQRLAATRLQQANSKAILCTYLNMTDDQLLKSNIIVYLINLLLCLPLVGLSVAAQLGGQLSQELKDAVWWLATLNCCACSYVYAITNKDFREAFNKLFYYCCCKSHVTFQRKTPIFRRQLDEDAHGHLRVHIIPGARVLGQRGASLAAAAAAAVDLQRHSSSLSPLVRPSSPLAGSAGHLGAHAADHVHQHQHQHQHRLQPQQPVRHHHMSPGGGFGGPAFANPQTRQLHRTAAAADRSQADRL